MGLSQGILISNAGTSFGLCAGDLAISDEGNDKVSGLGLIEGQYIGPNLG